jgi:hypothetical protein
MVQHFVNNPDGIRNSDWENADVERQLKSRGTQPIPVPASWIGMNPARAAEKKTAKKAAAQDQTPK